MSSEIEWKICLHVVVINQWNICCDISSIIPHLVFHFIIFDFFLLHRHVRVGPDNASIHQLINTAAAGKSHNTEEQK